MRRLNNLVTLFSAMFAFFFGCFLTNTLVNIDKTPTKHSMPGSAHHNGEYFLLILIYSAPSYFERRETIRETWLKLSNPIRHNKYPEEFIYLPQYDARGFLQMEDVKDQINRLSHFKDWLSHEDENDANNRRIINSKYLFVIGTKGLSNTLLQEINKEQQSNNDLLLLHDVYDSYSNLTNKVLRSVEAVMNQLSFDYILKADDDTYVKLDYLINELLSYDRKLIRNFGQYKNNPIPQLYWGFFNGRAQIKTRGQWREPNFYLCDRYLPYALGGGYIFSRGIAQFIESNSRQLSTYVSEDISFGTWISALRNIYRRHDVRFDTGYMPRKCRDYHLVLHKRTKEQMYDLFEKNFCTFEATNEQMVKRPMEYFYDWSKTADKCCDTIS